MAHNHGNEYQIRIVHKDGTEELSGLMNSTEQVPCYVMGSMVRQEMVLAETRLVADMLVNVSATDPG